MNRRILGLETEYAFSAIDRAGQRLDQETAVCRLLSIASRQLPHLPAPRCGGIFLKNGARFYVDHGMHPEMTTPECENPWDVVRYALAGERILAYLANEMMRQDSEIAKVFITKNNVDHSGTEATWGCHESYSHRADPDIVCEQMIPHLVSRIVYTGCGGFDNLENGLTFILSPRVPHLPNEVSDESTYDRGIFHTKDEPLAKGDIYRLHLICGESLCSEISAFLKVGTTAVVLAMIDGGLKPGSPVKLVNSVSAMNRFANDTTCTATTPTYRGEELTALQIQRRYLEMAEAHADAPFMPTWTRPVCELWRSVLDRLESDPESLCTVLDWAIRLRLFRQQLGRYKIDWARFRGYSNLSPLGATVGQSDRSATRRPTWDDLSAFDVAREELLELDLLFGQIGGTGVFSELDRAGVLNHHVPGVDDIDAAMTTPPASGRARIRGEIIRRFSSAGSCICDWQTVRNLRTHEWLDLTDPFETEVKWRKDAISGRRELGILGLGDIDELDF